MKHVSASTKHLLNHARRGALLLALGAAGPAAWGQSFGPMVTYSVGTLSHPFGVALGDLNGDGRPDIVTGNNGSNSVGVLLAQAGGGFATVVPYTVIGNPYAVVLGDVNGDGQLDIVSANYGANTVGVLLGTTGGRFAPVSTYPTGSGTSPMGVALTDLNGDGRLDIVTANIGTSSVGILLGTLSGGFTAATAFSTGNGSNPQSLALGDVNNDGHTDIITGNMATNNISVLLGQPNVTFAPASAYPTNSTRRC